MGKTSSPTATPTFICWLWKILSFLCALSFCFLFSWVSFSGHLFHFWQELNIWQAASHGSFKRVLPSSHNHSASRWRHRGSERLRDGSWPPSLWNLFLPDKIIRKDFKNSQDETWGLVDCGLEYLMPSPILQAPPSHWSVSGRLLNLSRKLTYLPLQGPEQEPRLSTSHLGMESGLQRIFQTLGSWVAGGPHTSQLAAAAPDGERKSSLGYLGSPSVDHF